MDLVIDVLHYEPEHLHHREDEGPTGHGAQVILQSALEGFPGASCITRSIK